MSYFDTDERGIARAISKYAPVVIIGGILILTLFGYITYTQFRVDVPSKHIAVMTRKTGTDLENNQEIAMKETQKGLQKSILTEGRHFKNPYVWDWEVYPMVEIPAGKMGVRVRLFGEDLPYGHYVATEENQKGIVQEVLRPGRYAINATIQGKDKSRLKNDFVEIVELHNPVTIPAGYKGVVTNLAGPLPKNPNVLLVENGTRGVQPKTLDPGTYYVNPYMIRINPVDCRSQRFNLAKNNDMGFPSLDGFWVALDGIVEFRIKPEMASEVFVTYNDVEDGDTIDQEIINKIIMPNARSFCRLRGSDFTGRNFINGNTRTQFQKEFQLAMKEACDPLGVEIIQALVTKIRPPDAIAGPVRDREVSEQKLGQYTKQIVQQAAEISLAVEKELIKQKQSLIDADRDVVKMTVQARQKQEVAVTKSKEELSVAQFNLNAAQDQAEAILARKKAEAGVIEFQNIAEAAGWKKAVEALGGDGEAFARYVLFKKLAPGYKQIMTNTANSPLMDVFKGFNSKKQGGE
jgi:hypothetical protein